MGGGRRRCIVKHAILEQRSHLINKHSVKGFIDMAAARLKADLKQTKLGNVVNFQS